MKRYFSIMAAITAALMLSVACSDDDDDAVVDDTTSSGSTTATPAITVVQSSVTATYEGGEFSVAYSITNPTSDGILIASASATWVENIDYSSTEGFVKFSIPASTETTKRTCTLTLTYEYSNTSVSKKIVIVQDRYNVYDELTCEHADMFYYGDNYNREGRYEYYVIFSDNGVTLNEDDGLIYVLANSNYISMRFISSTAVEDHSNIMLPEGTYTVGEDEVDGAIPMDDAVFEATDSDEVTEELYIVSGTVTVTHPDSTTTAVSGTVVDEDGGVHTFTFSGSFNVYYDMTQISSLTEDIDASFTATTQAAIYYGDRYNTGGAVWMLALYNNRRGVYIGYVGDSSYTAEVGLPTGTFKGANTCTIGTYLKGYYDGEDPVNSWYFSVNGEYMDDPWTPLEDGTVTVTDNEDGTYEVVTDCYDDKGVYKVMVTVNFTPEIEDRTSSTSSSSVKQASLAPENSVKLKSLKVTNRYSLVREL